MKEMLICLKFSDTCRSFKYALSSQGECASWTREKPGLSIIWRRIRPSTDIEHIEDLP
jgi:hypothetical protein